MAQFAVPALVKGVHLSHCVVKCVRRGLQSPRLGERNSALAHPLERSSKSRLENFSQNRIAENRARSSSGATSPFLREAGVRVCGFARPDCSHELSAHTEIQQWTGLPER